MDDCGVGVLDAAVFSVLPSYSNFLGPMFVSLIRVTSSKVVLGRHQH